MARLLLLLFLISSPLIAPAQPAPPPPTTADSDTIRWQTVSEWGVEGRGWDDVKRPYDRLPSRAQGRVRDRVWDLSRHSAGMSCRFITDAPEIQVRYSLFLERLAMSHMPASGVSGVDLYALLANGEWQWIGTVQPAARRVHASILRGLPPGRRMYQLNLPLYNGLDSLEIGVTKGAFFEPVAPRSERPVVFYGTSIMHGACASRPGMAIPAILGRRLNVPVINLGFSGNGKLEPEVGQLIAELDAAVYVVDCLPNLSPEETAVRAEPFIRQLRAARPSTPILLTEDRVFPNAAFLPGRLEEHRRRHAALRAAFEKLSSEGITGLYYLEGDGLLGFDGDATVDGSHPTDLGMVRYADAYEKVLRPILQPR